MFKDITPLLADADLFRAAIGAMASRFARQGITHVAAIESRGFLLGAPVALELGAATGSASESRASCRQRRASVEYALEYGTDRLEIHADACDAKATGPDRGRRAGDGWNRRWRRAVSFGSGALGWPGIHFS